MMKEHNPHQIGNIYIHKCISKYIPTCQKHINNINKLKKTQTGNNKTMKNNNTNTNHHSTPNTSNTNLKDTILKNTIKNQQTTMIQNHETTTSPLQYLNVIQPHIPQELISQQNLNQIKNIAEEFTEGLTSFFGFESRLNQPNTQSDYLIAVSSQKGEREKLLNLIKKRDIHQTPTTSTKWKNIQSFTEKWADQTSELYNKILGIWLEFDISSTNTQIPSIFLQTIPLRINTKHDINNLQWITEEALPQLNGKKLPQNVKEKFYEALQKLPQGSSVFQIASMLSRDTHGIRLVIKRIQPQDIVPYLQSLGWKDQNNGLKNHINEIKKYSDCIRLHINVTDSIDTTIGLECFISPEKYHQGNGWNEFFNHLIEKKACLPTIKNAVLTFPGVTQENPDDEFNYETYQPSVKLSDDTVSKAIVRYISHIKINYQPGKQIQAKAYTGVRLFGKQQ